MVKARQQEPICHVEHLFARNLFHLNGTGQQYTQIQHHLEQQIFRGSVKFYVIHQREHILLADFFRRVVDVFHIAAVQPQTPETHINGGARFRLRLGHLQLSPPCGQYLLARTADTLFANFTNRLKSCFKCFTVRITLFFNLN